MDVDQILPPLEGVDGSCGFPVKVGIDVPGRTGNVQHFHLRQSPNALDQIYGGNHCGVQPVKLFEGLQRRFSPLPPEPDGIGRAFSLGDPLLVHGMIL